MNSKKQSNLKAVNIIENNIAQLDSLMVEVVNCSSKNLLVISGGKAVHANPLFTKTFGYSKSEISNVNISEILTIEGARTTFENFLVKAASRKSTTTYKDKVIIVDKNNNEHLCNVSLRRCLWKEKVSMLLAIKLVADDDNLTNRIDQKSLELLDTALIASSQCVLDLNIASREFYISPAFYSMLGYNPKDFTVSLDSWLSLMYNDSLKEFEDFIESIKRGESFPRHWEHRVKTKLNGDKWFLCVWQVVEWDEAGKPGRLVGISMDINERKKLQIEKENFLETVSGFIKNSLDGFALIDENGVVIEWNPILESITSIKRCEVVGRYISNILEELIVNEKPQVELFTEFNKFYSTIARKGNNPWQGKYVEASALDGMYRPRILQHSLFTIQSHMGSRIAIAVKDITESKNSRLKLEKSDERLKLALNAGNLGIWDIDFVTGEKYFSPMTFTIFGYKPWEIDPSNKHWEKLIHPDDYLWVKEQAGKFMSSDGSLELVFRVKRKDGDSIWILSKNQLIRDSNNKPIRAIGTISDITRQKNIETELRQNEENLLKNLKQHEILSEISFILNTNKDFEIKNSEVIKLIGNFINCSRVYIFENKPEDGLMVNTYEWCNKGIEPQIQNLQGISLSKQQEWTQGSDLTMSWDLERDLAPDFAQFLREQDIQSFVIIPLQVSGKLFGYIGFDECTHPRKWRKEEIELLKTISNLISFSFERELVHKHYQLNEQRFRELTEKLPQTIFRVSLNGQIEFMNRVGHKTFGISKHDIEKGVYVWQILSLREVVKLKTIISRLLRSANIDEPIMLKATTATKKQELFEVYIRPKLRNGEITGLSGIALCAD